MSFTLVIAAFPAYYNDIESLASFTKRQLVRLNGVPKTIFIAI